MCCRVIRRALADELLFGRLVDGGRLTVDMKVTTDAKGVETGEVQLDITPPPKKENRSKPEAEEAAAGSVEGLSFVEGRWQMPPALFSVHVSV